MRALQYCNVAYDLQPTIIPHTGTDYLGVDNSLIKLFDPQPPPYSLGWPSTIMFVQPILEKLLRKSLLSKGNIKFLNDLRSTKKPIFVSTGMSSLEEIVNVSSSVDCLEFIHTQLDDKISGVNLKAISTIAQATQRPCGFGLHCELLEVLYSSISFTPSNIFFYVKDETGLENPDDYWAISISKVDEVTRNLKKLSTAVGDGKKEAKENVLHPSDDDITKKTI